MYEFCYRWKCKEEVRDNESKAERNGDADGGTGGWDEQGYYLFWLSFVTFLVINFNMIRDFYV